MKYREALDDLVAQHPALFGTPGEARDYDAIYVETYIEGSTWMSGGASGATSRQAWRRS